MLKVNISDLNSDEASAKYLEVVKRIAELEKFKKELRKKILSFHEDGFDLKSAGLNVVKQFRINYTKSKEAWVKAGKELPTKTIPARTVFDEAKFKAMLDFDENAEFRIGEESYQVRTK